jgi:formylglycine-generating enzyme required for sulfatase activity
LELERRTFNEFGLTQVHGSVAEMVAGCWNDTLRGLSGDARRFGRFGDCRRRVLRDAAATEPSTLKRVSVRRPILADDRRPQVGFRIARDL